MLPRSLFDRWPTFVAYSEPIIARRRLRQTVKSLLTIVITLPSGSGRGYAVAIYRVVNLNEYSVTSPAARTVRTSIMICRGSSVIYDPAPLPTLLVLFFMQSR